MTSPTMVRRPSVSFAIRTALAVAIALTAPLVVPGRAAACSCAMRETLAHFATPDYALFTGAAGAGIPRGVPVAVDRWLWGRGAAAQVFLAADSFGDGAACGTNVPPVGSRWLWVAWISDESPDFHIGLCNPAGDLATDDGQAKLAEALKVFEAIAPPTPVPEQTAEIGAAPTANPAAEARDGTGAVILGGLFGGALVLFGGAVLLARRGRRLA